MRTAHFAHALYLFVEEQYTLRNEHVVCTPTMQGSLGGRVFTPFGGSIFPPPDWTRVLPPHLHVTYYLAASPPLRVWRCRQQSAQLADRKCQLGLASISGFGSAPPPGSRWLGRNDQATSGCTACCALSQTRAK